MTTTDEALTEQIAQAIYEAAWHDGTRLQDQLDYHQELYRRKAVAVLPIIRKAQADAWQAGVNFALPSTETTHLARHNPHYPEEQS